MKKGEKAPFDGVLLSDAALAKIKTEHEKEIRLLKLENDKLNRENQLRKVTSQVICDAKVQAERSKLDACTKDRERQKVIYTKALDSKKCPSPVWQYLSFVGGSVVAGGICFAANRAIQ